MKSKSGALLEIAADLTASLSTEDRYQRLIDAVRTVVPCDATALLRYRGEVLVPVATHGLAPDVLGRTFIPDEHPRLARILVSRGPVRFEADESLPDPYDGMVEAGAREWSKVHSCMGCPLHVGGDLVGVLTMDSIDSGEFDGVEDTDLALLAALAAAAVRTAGLIESLEDLANRRGEVARNMVMDALKRQGGELLGRSAVMKELKKEIDVVCDSDLSVLITGETGTGKELVARTIHSRSKRAEQPLAYVNCAALPETIAESELFGHRKGAFTGASSDRAGKFEIADGGTLFLDEVGELPLSIQPKLLRALQSGEIQRVGADRNYKADVRIVAATNRDLSVEVKEGRFRADLYHRLSVYPIRAPALREHPDDIPLLAGRFLDIARTKLGLGPTKITSAGVDRLSTYLWPGNVRELEHVVMRAALRASGGRRGEEVVVDARHLDLDTDANPGGLAAGHLEPAEKSGQSLNEIVDSVRRDLIARTVAATEGNWAEAARRLRVDRGNLYRLARRLGLR